MKGDIAMKMYYSGINVNHQQFFMKTYVVAIVAKSLSICRI